MLASPALSHARVHSRPSVYWTDRFLEDTTLTVTVPGRWSPPRLLLWQGPLGSGLGWRWPLPQLWCLATLSDMLPLTSWGRVTPPSHPGPQAPLALASRRPSLLIHLPGCLSPPRPRPPAALIWTLSPEESEPAGGWSWGDAGGKPSRGKPGLHCRQIGAGIHWPESPSPPAHVAPALLESWVPPILTPRGRAPLGSSDGQAPAPPRRH